MADNQAAEDTLLTLTADIVAAHVSNNSVAVNDLPNLIQNVHHALTGISSTKPAAEEKPQPAVSVRSSIKPDYITCLECGQKQKMLKRHLSTAHNVTPPEYRQRFGLAADYPMVAPNYAEQRRTLAKSIGLGTKRKRTRASK
jgi:predicted transcriptional regulator